MRMTFKKIKYYKFNWKKIAILSFSFTVLIVAIISPIFGKENKKSSSEPVIYINKPSNLDWVNNQSSSVSNIFSQTLEGLVSKRDKTFDNLSDLTTKVLGFSPANFLQVAVGKRTYNLQNTEDSREIFNLLSRLQEFTSKNSGLLKENQGVEIDGETYGDYSLNMAEKIDKFSIQSYNDIDNGVTNPTGDTFVVKIRENSKWSDGSSIKALDFLKRIQYFQQSDKYFNKTKEDFINEAMFFENSMTETFKDLDSLAKQSKDTVVSNLEEMKNNIDSAIQDYSFLFNNDNPNELRKIFNLSDDFFNYMSKTVYKLLDLVDLSLTIDKVITNKVIFLRSFSDEKRNAYEIILKTILDTIKAKTSSLGVLRSSYLKTYRSLVFLNDSIVKLKRSPVNLRERIDEALTDSIEVINSLMPLLQDSEFFVSLFEQLDKLKIIKRSVIEESTSNSKDLFFEKQKENKSSDLSKLSLAKVLFPVARGLNTEDSKLHQERWRPKSGIDINNYCISKNTEDTFLLNRYSYITEDGELFEENNKEDFCNNFTLVYEKNNNLIFRFSKNMNTKEFLNILESPGMMPIKSSILNNQLSVKKQVNNAIEEKELMFTSNGSFKIDYINQYEVRFIKNENFWNKDNVFLDSFIFRFKNETEGVVEYRKNEEKFLDKKDLEIFNVENYFYNQDNTRSKLFLSNLFSKNGSNSFFQTKIGETIYWGEDFGTKVVHNYNIPKDGTCEILDSSLEYPEKTMDNYLCGVLPEYRNFYTAIRSLVSGSINISNLENYIETNVYKPAETFTPSRFAIDNNNVDYLDHVKNAVDYQNKIEIDLNNSNYTESFEYISSDGVLFKKDTNVYSSVNILKVNSFEGVDDSYSLSKNYHNKEKIVNFDSTSRETEENFEDSDLLNLERMRIIWSSIEEEVPKEWLENLNITISLEANNNMQLTSFIEKEWKNNIENISNNKITLNVLEVSSEESDYIYKDLEMNSGGIVERFLTLDSSLEKVSLGLKSIQPHIVSYFLKNIKDIISRDESLLVSNKTDLLNSIDKITEEVVEITEKKDRYDLKSFFSKASFLNLNENIKQLLLSQVEAFYLREGLIIPIQNSIEGVVNKAVTFPLKEGSDINLRESYSCLTEVPKITVKLASKEFSIDMPTCHEYFLIKELKRRLS